jgi:hypothetical protein
MKKIFVIILASFICLGINTAFSQTSNKNPNWVSKNGYWVIESNTKDKYNHVIWFYNNDAVVVYKETVSGTKLKHTKRKVRMKLKKILDSAVLTFENSNKNSFPAEQDLVSSVL